VIQHVIGSENAEYRFELLIARSWRSPACSELVVGRDSPARRTTLGIASTCRDGPCTAPLRQLSISIIRPTCYNSDQQRERPSAIAAIKVGWPPCSTFKLLGTGIPVTTRSQSRSAAWGQAGQSERILRPLPVTMIVTEVG
jgi:hypothetical protein